MAAGPACLGRAKRALEGALLPSQEAAAPEYVDLSPPVQLGSRRHHGLLHRALLAHLPLRSAAGECPARPPPWYWSLPATGRCSETSHSGLSPRIHRSGQVAGGRTGRPCRPNPPCRFSGLTLPSRLGHSQGLPCPREGAVSLWVPSARVHCAPTGHRQAVQGLLPGAPGVSVFPAPCSDTWLLHPPLSG